MLGSSFVSILKHDMCQGVTQKSTTVGAVVNTSFLMANADMEKYFTGLGGGDNWSIGSLMECLYYVAGWYAHAIKRQARDDWKI